MSIQISALYHGGIMVNYRCTAACRHCLYACSPSREAGYITPEAMRTVCGLLRAGRCRSVHIGGGEPFLDFKGLLAAVRELRNAGIRLDYVETNAFWAGLPDALEQLRRLRAEGVETLCISLDPFHAEYVPYGRPLELARLCETAGMDFFLWKETFTLPLSRLEPQKSHTRAEMEARLSPGYLREAVRTYGIRFGGRAVALERAYNPLLPYETLVDAEPCGGLLSADHFHVDLRACFIPPECTGLRLPLAELLEGIPSGRYPVFEALYRRGPAGLLDLARERGFEPDPSGYPSKCALCFDLRRYLSQYGYAELDPEHYEESLKYIF
jgi:hypothetical protein